MDEVELDFLTLDPSYLPVFKPVLLVQSLEGLCPHVLLPVLDPIQPVECQPLRLVPHEDLLEGDHESEEADVLHPLELVRHGHVLPHLLLDLDYLFLLLGVYSPAKETQTVVIGVLDYLFSLVPLYFDSFQSFLCFKCPLQAPSNPEFFPSPDIFGL